MMDNPIMNTKLPYLLSSYIQIRERLSFVTSGWLALRCFRVVVGKYFFFCGVFFSFFFGLFRVLLCQKRFERPLFVEYSGGKKKKSKIAKNYNDIIARRFLQLYLPLPPSLSILSSYYCRNFFLESKNGIVFVLG